MVSRSVGEWFVSVSRALRGGDGTLENVIVAAFDSRYFAELWRGVDVGEDGSIALLSREGTLMLRSPMVEEMIGRSFADTLAFREYLTNSSAATYTATSTVDDIERIVSVRIVHDYRSSSCWSAVLSATALADEAGAVATKILHALHLGA